MEFNLNIYNILIAFGMFQGFVIAILLISRSSFQQANKYLGFTILFLALYLVWVLKYDMKLQSHWPDLRFLPVLFIWGIGPSFYLFSKFSVKQGVKLSKIKWYFLPLAVELLYFNIVTIIFWANDFNHRNFTKLEDEVVIQLFNIEHVIGLLLIAFYLGKSILLFRKKNILSRKNYLTYILLAFSILWLIWVPYTYIDIVYYNFNFPPSEFYSFYLLFAALTYAIGFLGFKMSKDVSFTMKKSESDESLKEIAVYFQSEMTRTKCYRDPELNLQEFAQLVGQHPNKVSMVLNQVLQVSFREFINSYRIEEFKRRLPQYDLQKHTLLSLAFEVGFNSKASFNRIFKNSEAMSPIEYLQKVK
ncbi:MAG: helix-turn-helix domain-containing protein [bacterium]|nr:helix-turn-helix domain-containing protein [bacterium]